MPANKNTSFYSALPAVSATQVSIPTLRIIGGPQVGQPVTVDRQVVDPVGKEESAAVVAQPNTLVSPKLPPKVLAPDEVGKLIVRPMNLPLYPGRGYATADTHNGADMTSGDGRIYAVSAGVVGVANDKYNAALVQQAIAKSQALPGKDGDANRYLFCQKLAPGDVDGYNILINTFGFNWKDGVGYSVQYLHLAGPPVINGVPAKFGMPVAKGDFLGMMGATGYSFGAHLHLILTKTTAGDTNINAVFAAEGYTI